MSKFKIISKNTSNFLPDGKHAVEIISVEECTSNESTDWSDVTNQVKVTCRDKSGGLFIAYFNLDGFVKYEDLTDTQLKSKKFASAGDAGYAIDTKTRKRLISNDNSSSAQSILQGFVCNAGVPEDQEIDVSDLVGLRVGIEIGRNENNKPRLKRSFMLPETAVAMNA